MRVGPVCCTVLALAACLKTQEQPAATDTATARPAFALSALAGRWRVRAFNDAGDSIVGYELTGTSDTTGWTISFPGRSPIPVRVGTTGRRLTLEAGPYESVLRRGVQVRIQGTARLEGDSLVGTTIARYSTAGADSVLRIRTVGRRIPQ